jgi:hypothetical protein
VPDHSRPVKSEFDYLSDLRKVWIVSDVNAEPGR